MKPSRILVVEDEGIVARDIQTTLEKMGYEVPALASTANEAVEKTAEFNPDLVLMDIVLWRGDDGITAAERVRQRFDVPIVYLTAHSDNSTFQKAKLTEPYGYIVKPVVERELRIGIEVALHKHQKEKSRAQLDHWFATTLDSIGEAVIATDRTGEVRFMNTMAEDLTGCILLEATGRHLDEVLVLCQEQDTAHFKGLFAETLEHGLVVQWTSNAWLYPQRGSCMPIDYTSARIRHPNGDVAGVVVVFRDITPRKHLEEERESLIGELRAALGNVKTLRTLLPVCCSCKRIRDDDGYWAQVDAYVTNHHLADVSHSICPECVRLLYPELANESMKLAAEEAQTVQSPPENSPLNE